MCAIAHTSIKTLMPLVEQAVKSYKYHWKFIPFEKKDPSEFIDIEKTLKENLEILFNMGIKIGRAKIGKLLSAKRKEKREKMLKDLAE